MFKTLCKQELLPDWHWPDSWILQATEQEVVNCHISHVTEVDWGRRRSVQNHRAPARTLEDLEVAAGPWQVIRDLLKATRQVSVPGQGSFSRPCVQHMLTAGSWLFPMAGTTSLLPSVFHGSAGKAGCSGAIPCLQSLQKQRNATQHSCSSRFPHWEACMRGWVGKPSSAGQRGTYVWAGRAGKGSARGCSSQPWVRGHQHTVSSIP